MSGPSFEELLDVTRSYVDTRVRIPKNGDHRDIGIYERRHQALDVLDNAIRTAAGTTSAAVPILAEPEWLDSAAVGRFQWTGIIAEGKKCNTTKVPCHTDLEKQFADFLDNAKDVLRYIKNERFKFSVTYYENNRTRQFYPDFIVAVRNDDGTETMWLAETKGEMRLNVPLKNAGAHQWCEKMSATKYGPWQYLFAQQVPLTAALVKGIKSFKDLAAILQAVSQKTVAVPVTTPASS